MKIYEAKIIYTCIRDDLAPPLCDSPEKVVEFMDEAFSEDPTVEWFFVISLNRKNRALGRTAITKGTATASLVHPREIFRPLILSGASAFICVHNHPSGDPSPSQADIRATRQLREASKAMQIEFLDHVIIGEKSVDPGKQGFYSFAEAGLL